MSIVNKRKAAAAHLGIAIHQRYENMVTATSEDELVAAAVELAQVMYENVEFVIWALKKVGGLDPAPPEEIRKVRVTRKPLEAVVKEQCTCPVLEEGIIGRDKHMTSCPLYVPA